MSVQLSAGKSQKTFFQMCSFRQNTQSEIFRKLKINVKVYDYTYEVFLYNFLNGNSSE